MAHLLPASQFTMGTTTTIVVGIGTLKTNNSDFTDPYPTMLPHWPAL